MALMTISQVAREVGLRPSAIRYYERIGLLPPPPRQGGQRRYDPAVLHRLALIQGARSSGFTLDEVRELITGFADGTPAGQRWRALAGKKLAELDAMSRRIEAMREMVRRLETRCGCTAVDDCGRAMYEASKGRVRARSAPRPRGRSSRAD